MDQRVAVGVLCVRLARMLGVVLACAVVMGAGDGGASGKARTRAPIAKRIVIEERADGEHQAALARHARAGVPVIASSAASKTFAATHATATVAGTGTTGAPDVLSTQADREGVAADVLVRASDGYKGDVTVDGVSLGAGFTLREFVAASKSRNVRVDGPADAVRLVRGPEATAPTPTMTLGMFDDAPGLLSREDLQRAGPSIAAAATSTNLNQCVDVDRACEFSFDLVFDAAVTDNCAGADALPELLFFERSAGRAGDAVTVQALDERGMEVGRAVVLGCDVGRECSPAANAAVFDRKLQVTGYESVTFIAVDLSSLGVSNVRTLRVRTPRAGDETLDGRAWSGSAGMPDFKVVGVDTNVTLPSWLIGD